MAVAVGIDVAKRTHWVEIKTREEGTVLVSRPVDNSPGKISELIDQIRELEVEHGPARVAIDLLGGIAVLLQADQLGHSRPR